MVREFAKRCRPLLPEDGSFPEGGRLPIVVDLSGFRGIDELTEWLAERHADVHSRLLDHGAIWFRGAVIESVLDFQRLAKALEPELATTHPFDDGRRRWRSEHVWEAGGNVVGTHLDSMVLPFHNEDSYIPVIPRRLLFCCITPPALGGETSLVDCRRVLADIPRRTLRKFEMRSYPARKVLPLDVVLANARLTVASDAEQLARTRSGADVSVEAGNLILSSRQSAIVEHPDTGERVWANRLKSSSTAGRVLDMVMGISKAPKELRLQALSTTLRLAGPRVIHALCSTLLIRGHRRRGISVLDDWNLVRAYWKNAIIVRWRAGDFVLLDNRLVAHGRMPFRGARDIVGALVP